MMEVVTILLQLSYSGDRYNTVLEALAISALAIPYDRDHYDTVFVALEISYDGNRVGNTVRCISLLPMPMPITA